MFARNGAASDAWWRRQLWLHQLQTTKNPRLLCCRGKPVCAAQMSESSLVAPLRARAMCECLHRTRPQHSAPPSPFDVAVSACRREREKTRVERPSFVSRASGARRKVGIGTVLYRSVLLYTNLNPILLWNSVGREREIPCGFGGTCKSRKEGCTGFVTSKSFATL